MKAETIKANEKPKLPPIEQSPSKIGNDYKSAMPKPDTNASKPKEFEEEKEKVYNKSKEVEKEKGNGDTTSKSKDKEKEKPKESDKFSVLDKDIYLVILLLIEIG